MKNYKNKPLRMLCRIFKKKKKGSKYKFGNPPFQCNTATGNKIRSLGTQSSLPFALIKTLESQQFLATKVLIPILYSNNKLHKNYICEKFL